MNKTEFIKAFADKAALTIKDAQEVYDAFVAVITETLKKSLRPLSRSTRFQPKLHLKTIR